MTAAGKAMPIVRKLRQSPALGDRRSAVRLAVGTDVFITKAFLQCLLLVSPAAVKIEEDCGCPVTDR
jgi:hypothetical protein